MSDSHKSTGSTLIDELRLQAWLARAELRNPSLHKEVSGLAQMRDELRLQAHLGKLEAKDELDKLDGTWRKVKAHLEDAAETANDDAKALLSDIRAAYERLTSD